MRSILHYLALLLFIWWLFRDLTWRADELVAFTMVWLIVLAIAAIVGHIRNENMRRRRDRELREIIDAIKSLNGSGRGSE